MRIVKKIVKWFLYFLLIPISYLVVALILSFITIDRKIENSNSNKSIFISTNGVHLDIIIPKQDLDSLFLSGIMHNKTDDYLAFGWGDENFYINTPTWNDLTFGNAFKAMFLKSSTLMHVTRYKKKRPDWVEVKLSKSELQKMENYLLNTFETDENGMKIMLANKGYSTMDDFYKSKGSYSCLNTCNSWVNAGFKESGLKACFWTPFDFGLLKKYE